MTQLETHVHVLAGEIGERNVTRPQAYEAAARYIEQHLLHTTRQTFKVGRVSCANIESEVKGTSDDIIVIGAHYDSVVGSPGADDNGSGVAALLAIADASANAKPRRTIRFVAFANEEPPHFMTDAMGSFRYAERCKQRKEKIVAMISLETIAYFSDAQEYPAGLESMYPPTGYFIAFASNPASKALLDRCLASYRSNVPAEGGALPEDVPGVAWSDQWSFWRFGYPAVMVTDTAPFRNPHYHTRNDKPETLDYARFADVVDGLKSVVEALAND